MSPVRAAGPEAETAALYERFNAQIFRYCLGRLRSREDAEDAVQNTFLRVYAALRKGVVPEFESAWLFKIAHNVCLSRAVGVSRRSKVEAPADLQLLEDSLPAPSQNGHDDLFGLDDALARMPENLRRAILLREWQGLSYAEIADELGVSQSAVETLIFRARRYLANALEQGVKEPLRKVAKALNIGSLLGGLRALLGGATAAKVATGVALVGMGAAGGGIALSHTFSSTHATKRGASVRPVVAVPARGGQPASGPGTAKPKPKPGKPAAAGRIPVKPSPAHHGTRRGGHGTTPPSSPSGGGSSQPSPGSGGTSGPTSQPSSPGQASAPAFGGESASSPPATTLLPTAPAPPQVSPLAPPAASVPSAPATPLVSVPAVTPLVDTPTLSTPAVTTPAAGSVVEVPALPAAPVTAPTLP